MIEQFVQIYSYCSDTCIKKKKYMIKTGDEDPILVEFGLNNNASFSQKSAAVIGKGVRNFVEISSSTFAIYNFIYLFDNIKNNQPINWKNNAKYSALISCRFAAEQSLTIVLADSFAFCRGRRSFYDPVLAGGISGATMEARNGWPAIKKGAFNGALTQLMLQSFNYAIQKLSSAQDSSKH